LEVAELQAAVKAHRLVMLAGVTPRLDWRQK